MPKARPGGDKATASPIVPPQAIAGRTLVLVIAIMTFLAGFTIAVVSVIDRAADAWGAVSNNQFQLLLYSHFPGLFTYRGYQLARVLCRWSQLCMHHRSAAGT